jgi:hypothetical protein
MYVRELAVRVLHADFDLALRAARAAADLGDRVLEAFRQIDARAGLPVTRLRIGSPCMPINPSTTSRPVRPSTSTWRSMRLKTGS